MVLTVYFVLSSAIGLFCHRRLADLKVLSSPVEPNEPPQDLTPASRRQDHTTSPSASCAVVLRAAYRSRRAIRPALRTRTPNAAASTASRPASVTIAIRPSCGTRQLCL